jgi:hypothetical protein
MKLLSDQNLSPQLVNRLADLFPGSSHVQTEGLGSASPDALIHDPVKEVHFWLGLTNRIGRAGQFRQIPQENSTVPPSGQRLAARAEA